METGCCGADFRNDKATFLGLMTLSMPMIFFSSLASGLLSPLPVLMRTKKISRALLASNLELVRLAALAPRLRCGLAGGLYPFSPRLSGALYRSFNLIAFSFIWACIIAAFWVAAGACA